MKTRPVFLHIRNTRNLGDLASCPADGFRAFDDCDRLDWRDWPKIAPGTPLILGGGGLFMKGTVQALWAMLNKHPVAIWGAGLNYPLSVFDAEEEAALVAELKRCGVVGVRNPKFAAKHGFDFVPCASAMSECLEDRHYENRLFTVLAYEHLDRRFAGSRYPAITNHGDSFFAAVNHIASAGQIVTNSYHGAYWTSLLGREPILWKPEQFGNRFDDWCFSSAPRRVSNFAELRNELQLYAPHGDIRHEAVALNSDFFNKVVAWLESR